MAKEVKVKPPKKIWDNCEEVCSVMKSPGKKFVISLAAREGIKYINIREFCLRRGDNGWGPGMNGMTVPFAMPVFNEETQTIEYMYPLKDLIKTLIEVSPKLIDFELDNETNAVYQKEKVKK